MTLKDEVLDVRKNQAPELFRQTVERHTPSGLRGKDWDPFLLDYKGDVDEILSSHLGKVRSNLSGWRGVPPAENNGDASPIANDADLGRLPLVTLEAGIARQQRLVSADRNM